MKQSQLSIAEERKVERDSIPTDLTKAITQAIIEAAKAAIMAVTETDGSTKCRKVAQAVPKAGEPTLRQLTFNWKV